MSVNFQPMSFTNEIGQTFNPGDLCVVITSNYDKKTKTSIGFYAGVREIDDQSQPHVVVLVAKIDSRRWLKSTNSPVTKLWTEQLYYKALEGRTIEFDQMFNDIDRSTNRVRWGIMTLFINRIFKIDPSSLNNPQNLPIEQVIEQIVLSNSRKVIAARFLDDCM